MVEDYLKNGEITFPTLKMNFSVISPPVFNVIKTSVRNCVRNYARRKICGFTPPRRCLDARIFCIRTLV